jgi:hypothetical protein
MPFLHHLIHLRKDDVYRNQTSIFFGLSLRQLLFSLLAVGVAVLLYCYSERLNVLDTGATTKITIHNKHLKNL